MKIKYEVLPANLPVSLVNKDGFLILFTASISLSNYTFDGGVYDSSWKRVADFTITSVDLPNGKVQASLTKIQTQALGAATYNWDFRWIDGSGNERTIVNGPFIIVNG